MGILEPSAGRLRHRVRFERRSADPVGDGYGNTDRDWETLIASRAAELTPTRGGEQTIAARAQGVSSWDLWVYFDTATAQVTPGDRVVNANDPDQVFNIKFIGDMTGRRRMLLMQLELGVAV